MANKLTFPYKVKPGYVWLRVGPNTKWFDKRTLHQGCMDREVLVQPFKLKNDDKIFERFPAL